MTEQTTDNLVEDLITRFSMKEQMAECAVRVASGIKLFDAVEEVYNYTSRPNIYKQIKDLMRNEKFDKALKYLGFNLKEHSEKHAFGIIRAFEEIAFSKSEGTGNRLTALKELAKYNPTLISMMKEEVDRDGLDRDEEELKEFFKQEEVIPVADD